MWEKFKEAQSWADITKNYKQLVQQYKEFGLDLLNMKEELEFYIKALPIVFFAGAIVHLYFFRKAHSQIAKLQGQKQAMRKQIVFLRQLLEKRIEPKIQLNEQSDQRVQQIISTKNSSENRQQLLQFNQKIDEAQQLKKIDQDQ